MRPAISPRTLARLPMYYRYLEDLNRQGVERISSHLLSGRLGITASQLRQDLSAFGQFGQQGYGYRVDELLRSVAKVMGLDREHNLVLVGAGNIGRALLSYDNFSRRGFKVLRIFDVSPDIVGQRINDIPVDHSRNLAAFLAEHPVEIGVITAPSAVAQQTADLLVAGGVTGIWNFAPVQLKVPSHVFLEHVHISDSLFLLSLRMQAGC